MGETIHRPHNVNLFELQFSFVKYNMRLGLCGSFGFGNVGDEAIPLALDDLCRLNSIPLDFVPISRFNNVSLKRLANNSDVTDQFLEQNEVREMWHVGGGVIEPGVNSVLSRCQALGRNLKHRIVAGNVANGVYYGFWEKRKISKALAVLESISVRDHHSLVALKNYFNISEPDLVGDLVLWLQPDNDSCEIPSIPSGKYVACNFNSAWSNEPGFFEWAASVIDLVFEVTGLPIVLFPMSEIHDSDTVVHRKLLSFLSSTMATNVILVEGITNPRQIMRHVARSSLVVAMRLHANIMAYAMQVPFIAIEYNRKLSGFARTVNLPNNLLSPIGHGRKANSCTVLEFSPLVCPKREILRRIEFSLTNSCFDLLKPLRNRLSKHIQLIAEELKTEVASCV